MNNREAMEQLRRSEQRFTSDDIEDLAGHPDPTHEQNGPNNSMGALFREYSKAKKIKEVGITRSRQPSRRGGMIREWVGIPDSQQALGD